MSVLSDLYHQVVETHPGEVEFHQSVKEVFDTLEPLIQLNSTYTLLGVFERLVEPERVIIFRVPWVDDQQVVRVNRGYRVQFNSAIGPYKGGLRFHPSVNLSILKFLGFEQTFKNALTGLPLGGGKGGSDFDPKDKSDGEVMRFCQSYMIELQRHLGADTDIPAGDIGVGAREVGYMYGMYKKIRNESTGTLTGKAPSYGGSLVRPEATGYGLCYFVEEAIAELKGKSFKGSTVIISGSGNVAIHAMQKATSLGATVIAMSDSSGYIVDREGIDYATLKLIKINHRLPISEYVKHRSSARYYDHPEGMWMVPCDIALPCATQNELDDVAAQALVDNGCFAVGEGANMPCTPAAIKVLKKNKVVFAPGKAANAGGVSVSGLEMAQNAMHLSWSFAEVDLQLQGIMHHIFTTVHDTASTFGDPMDLEKGANIAGFLKVADAMIAQGII
jgi:glutamate dehydrogenase (NADP+)